MRRWMWLATLFPASAFALGQLLPTPAGSQRFGKDVVFLPNGNFVVTDPQWSANVEAAGAVYLYSPTGVMLSRLTGSHADDNIGSEGIVVLANGNFVVRSASWDNDAAQDAGAVTFGDADTGFVDADGGNATETAVDIFNSLVGTSSDQHVGEPGVFALPNGNYVVASDHWGSAALPARGAVTLCDGTLGASGPVATSNSLVGTHAGDHVGFSITVLANGNYVVTSPFWDNDATVDVGAVTWRPAHSTSPAVVSPQNSIVGSSAGDEAGSAGTVALDNGNYVFASPQWDDGAASNAGAVTWGSGDGSLIGFVDASTSYVGSVKADSIGANGVIALDGGDYAFASPAWDRGGIVDAGAVTRGDGAVGSFGAVGATNSMVGSKVGDGVGSGGLTALSNGDFVALSPQWHDAANLAVGAATRLPSDGSAIGEIDTSASLAGSSANDFESATVTSLTDGAYVVATPFADVIGVQNAGAATRCSNLVPCPTSIASATSLIGGATNDLVGTNVVALPDGGYVVANPFVDKAPLPDVGSINWGVPGGGITGFAATAGTPLTGASADDHVGLGGVLALPNNSYAIFSPQWRGPHGALTGAVTLAPTPFGEVGLQNSAYASAAGDQLGFQPRPVVTDDGLMILSIPHAGNAGQPNAGAVIALDVSAGAIDDGELDYDSGIRGNTPQGGPAMRHVWHQASRNLVVSDPLSNRVWIAHLALASQPFGPIFRNGFE